MRVFVRMSVSEISIEGFAFIHGHDDDDVDAVIMLVYAVLHTFERFHVNIDDVFPLLFYTEK